MSKTKKRDSNSTTEDFSVLLGFFVNLLEVFLSCLQAVMRKLRENKTKFRKSLSEYFSDYSNNTSIHGMKYLGEKNRSIAERLLWLIVMSISLYLCAYLIVKSYKRWETAPATTTLAKNTPIWKIPFPAVTICPETKVKQRTYNFTEAVGEYFSTLQDIVTDEWKTYQQAILFCNTFAEIWDIQTFQYDVLDFLSKVAPQLSDTFHKCRWMINDNFLPCNDLFTPLFTEAGVCFTFNIMDREDLFTDKVYCYRNYLQHNITSTNWTLEKGYLDSDLEDPRAKVFPRRATAAGEMWSFMFDVTLNEYDVDDLCGGGVRGFKILLHNPAEVPRVNKLHFSIPLNKEVVITVKPEMTTSEGLRSYDPQKRECYFSDERKLKYFKIYTKPNCELECFTNHTIKKCDCVAFYMPYDNSTEICGPGKQHCLETTKAGVNEREGLQSFNRGSVSESQETCNCLPSCTSLSYRMEVAHTTSNWLKRDKIYSKFFDQDITVNDSFMYSEPGATKTNLFIFFRDHEFIAFERREVYELYSITDFIANCGGLLGVFTGFSFLSAFEILYFVTLRLLCNMRRYRRAFWSASPDDNFDV